MEKLKLVAAREIMVSCKTKKTHARSNNRIVITTLAHKTFKTEKVYVTA